MESRSSHPTRPRTAIAVLVAGAMAASVMTGCGGAADSKDGASSGGGEGGSTVSLVAYSTPQVVYDEIIPKFNASEAGKDITVRTSFGASGEQSRAVAEGLKADVVSFSVEPDVTRLVDKGLVPAEWKTGPNRGLVTTSVVSFIVRPGNPKNIRSWDDLLKPGVEVITPNPFTSGAAKWNLLGGYAHGGLPYVEKLLTEHVKIQPRSGREALQTFTSGRGDVLLSYEYEAITAQKKGEKVDLVIPPKSLRIDIDLATTTSASADAKAFHDYILGPEAQRLFASWGYRPVNAEALKEAETTLGKLGELSTIEDLGGWKKVNEELFDPDAGSIARIESRLGVSTSK